MITWVNPKRGVSGFRSANSGARIKTYSNDQLCITLYEPIMKIARLYVGDKVRIGFDDDFLYIVRSKDEGYTLSTTGPKGAREEHTGTHHRACIKMTGYSEIDWPERELLIDEIITDDPQYTVVIPRRKKQLSSTETLTEPKMQPSKRGDRK